MTSIEWTQKTWNPIAGCTVLSPGCTNCYAMRMAARLERMGSAPHYAGTTKTVKGKAVWTGKIALVPDRTLLEPWRRKKPTVYFVNSMSDLFHEDVPDAWIDRVFAVMSECPQHTFQVLTKRSARMRAYMTSYANGERDPVDIGRRIVLPISLRLIGTQGGYVSRPAPNIWVGVSAERQTEANERVLDLLHTPAAVRFVSAEPLLGPIDFTRIPSVRHHDKQPYDVDALKYPDERIDWAIVGGESGPGARPMHPDWARSIRDQCSAAGVSFFFKQYGAWAPIPWHGDECGRELERMAGARNGKWDAETDTIRVGKKAAGRLLDGREWNEMPRVGTAREEAA